MDRYSVNTQHINGRYALVDSFTSKAWAIKFAQDLADHPPACVTEVVVDDDKRGLPIRSFYIKPQEG